MNGTKLYQKLAIVPIVALCLAVAGCNKQADNGTITPTTTANTSTTTTTGKNTTLNYSKNSPLDTSICLHKQILHRLSIQLTQRR